MTIRPFAWFRETKMKAEDADLVADGLMKVGEVEAFFDCSRSTVYNWMYQGLLAYVKLGRSRRIPRRAVLELAARGLRGGGQRDAD